MPSAPPPASQFCASSLSRSTRPRCSRTYCNPSASATRASSRTRRGMRVTAAHANWRAAATSTGIRRRWRCPSAATSIWRRSRRAPTSLPDRVPRTGGRLLGQGSVLDLARARCIAEGSAHAERGGCWVSGGVRMHGASEHDEYGERRRRRRRLCTDGPRRSD